MQQLKEDIKVLSIKEMINNGTSEDKILEICDRIYNMIDFVTNDYPKLKSWFFKKHLPGTLDKKSNRDIIIACDKDNIYGTTFIKYDDEKKICTLFVVPEVRGLEIGTLLLDKAMDILGTTKPMITFPEYKLVEFEPIIKKYNWQQTQTLEGFYNTQNTELVFNGILER